MTVERLPITDREQWLKMRLQDVTASDIGAVCGCSPFKTALGLWAEKTGGAAAQPDTPIMARGRHLEDGIINAVIEKWPERSIIKPGVYLRDPAARIGATPDAFVYERAGDRSKPIGILQCKLVGSFRFRDEWEDGVPLHYQLQALTEAMLADVPMAWLAVYEIDAYKGNLHLFEVPRHAGAEARIREAVAQFWKDTEAGRMPKADYDRDAQLLAFLKPPVAGAAPIDLSGDNMLPEILEERERLNAEIKEREARVEQIKAEVLDKLNGAPAAVLPGWKLTNTITNRKEKLMPAASFPVLRISRRKEA